MVGPLLFGLLVALAVLIGFVAVWRIVRSWDPVDARLAVYGASETREIGLETAHRGQRHAWSGVNRLLAGFSLGPRLAMALSRADVMLTAAEFSLIVVGVALVGFVLGSLRAGVLVGLALGALGGYLPLLYLRSRQARRLRAFTEQLPDVLTLMVGGLRAGYGLSQTLELLVEQLPAPASAEFGRVLRAVGLGLPVQQALRDMTDRIDSDDLYLMVTAITVQYEMGGNLAQTLETIGETVRDRIYMLRQIRVLTSHQRITGYVLAALPFALSLALFLLNPAYIRRLFQPGWIRLLPIVAVLMQIAGFLVIRKIVDIEA